MLRIHTRFSGLLASCVLMLATAFPAFSDEPVVIQSYGPKLAQPMEFKDDQGTIHTVNADKAALTLVHFWATWCVPCVAEFPDIDALQKEYSAKGVKIIAISLDGDSNMAKVKKFYTDHKIGSLAPYLDISNKAFTASKAPGLPTTLFLNKEGKEIGRIEGPADWKDASVRTFIEKHLK